MRLLPACLASCLLAVAAASPAAALVSYSATITSILTATAGSGVTIDYDFSNYSGAAHHLGDGVSSWSDDHSSDALSLIIDPAVEGGAGPSGWAASESLNDGMVTLTNLTDAVSTVDFVLSYDLRSEASRDTIQDHARALASLSIQGLGAAYAIDWSVSAFAGGDYAPPLAASIGQWNFSITLSAGQSASLAIFADVMGEADMGFSSPPSRVPLPGALPLAAAGLAALAGVAALRRRRGGPSA